MVALKRNFVLLLSIGSEGAIRCCWPQWERGQIPFGKIKFTPPHLLHNILHLHYHYLQDFISYPVNVILLFVKPNFRLTDNKFLYIYNSLFHGLFLCGICGSCFYVLVLYFFTFFFSCGVFTFRWVLVNFL